MALTADAEGSPGAGDGPAATRWRRLVTERLGEVQRLAPESGSFSSGSFWDRRAERYAAHAPVAAATSDPFLRRLLSVSDASSSVIDAGAGSGRFALALAGRVRHVTAIDPSEAMLAVLRRGAEQLGVTNVETIQATWQQADAAPADVTFSAFVLTLVADGAAFVAKLDAAARSRVLLYLGAYSGDALLDPLWRHFHDAPRAPGPSYLDAVALVRELGIDPAVKVVEIANPRRYATIAEAVEQYRDGLLLPDDPDVISELADLLGHWLVGRKGALRSALRTVPAAIVEWTPQLARP